VLGYMTWQTSLTNDRLARDLVETRAAAERAKADAIAAAARASATVASTSLLAAPPGSAGEAGALATEFVPYGEVPFAGSRLDRLRVLAATLESQQFHGTIRIEAFVGDFCLAGSATDGFQVAAGDTPASKCDLVGNPYDEALSPAQRQSVDFANFSAMLERRSAGAIRVEVVNGGRRQPVAYPAQDDKTTASAWNVVAAQNNRVEFRTVPAA
jgi:hypothetical protein